MNSDNFIQNSSIMKRIRLISLIAIVAIVFTFCSNKKQELNPVVNVSEQEPAKDSVKLKGYSIHKVKLPFTYVGLDENGVKKQYEQAWLVKLEFESFPKYTSFTVNIAIGDYILPEYGSWKKGLYFKVYDAALLEKLNNKSILYSLPGSKEMVPTNKVFTIAAYKDLTPENEREVLNKEM
jgi:hypothetical protein